MALKRSKAIVAEKETTTKSEIPTIEVGGSIVAAYNLAVAAQKKAEAEVKENRPAVEEFGVAEIFRINVDNPTNPITSVKLVDETGAVVRVTSQDRYSAVDPDAVERLFENLNDADPNEFVQEVVKPAFDAKVFYGQDGNFRDEVFNAYQRAIQKVTTELVAAGKLAAGTGSPLVGKRLFMPKPTFNAQRWSNFPTVEAQTAISSVLTNTVTLTPVAAAE